MNIRELLGGYHAAQKVLVLLFAYNVTCLLLFATIYYSTGFDRHFNLPPDVKPTYVNALYYSLATQATCMAGEITPKTAFGRGVLSFQITSAYLTSMVLIVPWIHAAQRRSA